MAQVLPIAQLGHPILREVARPVEDLSNSTVQDFMDNLLATLAAHPGLGLAAPQVYESRRIIVISSRPTPRYPDAAYLEPFILINPQLRETSEEIVKIWETCLSIPGIGGLVPRTHCVTIEYTNREGTNAEQELSGLAARVFLHELDHLNGLVFLDRLESTKDIISQEELLKRNA
jgi:peptide deformylase